MAAADNALTSEQVLVVGRVMAVHGVQGWVKVYSHTDPMENIFEYQPWYMRRGEHWLPVTLTGKRRQGKGLVAGVQGCNDRDQAQQELVGRDIAVPRDLLPRSGGGDYYWRDLMHAAVRDTNSMISNTSFATFASFLGRFFTKTIILHAFLC